MEVDGQRWNVIIHKGHFQFVICAIFISLITFNWFSGVGFFAGADLGLGLVRPNDFLHIYQYNWNGLDGFGQPVYGYLEIPYLQTMVFLQSIFGGKAQVLFLTIPVISAFSLTYFGLIRLKLGAPAISLLGAAIMSIGPLVTFRIWNVPIPASFGTLVFGALILYLMCLIIGPDRFRIWRVVVPLLLLAPFYLLAFTNPYYAMGASIPFVLLSAYMLLTHAYSYLKKNERYGRFRLELPEIMTILLFTAMVIFLILLPLFSSGIAGDRISTISSQNQSSLVDYVRGESRTPFAVTIFSYDPSAENLSGLARLFLSTLLVSLALIPLFELRSIPIHLRRAYMFFLAILIVGWTLEKGIQEPFAQLNEAFYRALGSLAIGFRSPSSKFSIIQVIALAPLAAIGLSRMVYSTLPLIKKPFFKHGINVKYIVVGTLVFLMVAYSITDPLVSGDLGANQVMKQPNDLLTPHLQKINDLIKPYGQGRLLLLPLDYNIWSAYKLDNNSEGYQYLGPNEYMVIGAPTLTQYESGLNEFLRLLINEQNPSGIRALFKLGNINTIVFDAQKVDPTGNFPAAQQKAWLATLQSALGSDIEEIPSEWPFIAYHSKIPSSYCYAAEARPGVNESTNTVDLMNNGGMVLANKSSGVGDVVNNVGNISIPFHSDPGNLSALITWDFSVPVQISDIPDILATMKVSDSWNVSGIVIDLISTNGSELSWVIPKPYPFENLRLEADSAFLLGDGSNVTEIHQLILRVNTISSTPEDFHFEISQLNIVPSTRLALTPLPFEWIDSDHWIVHVNNGSTGLIIFSQTFDPYWTLSDGDSTSARSYGLYQINVFNGSFHGDLKINYIDPIKIPSYLDGMTIFLIILIVILFVEIAWWSIRKY